MSRWIAVVVVFVLVFVVGGVLVTFIQRARYEANIAASRNNLRQLALFAVHHVDPAAVKPGLNLPREVPAATVVLPGVTPENRLSWVVKVLPGLDQSKNQIEAVLAEIDVTQPWPAERNQRAARTRLNALLCPENTPELPPHAPRSRAMWVLPATASTPPRSCCRRPVRRRRGRRVSLRCADAVRPHPRRLESGAADGRIGERSRTVAARRARDDTRRRRFPQCQAAHREWRPVRWILPDRRHTSRSATGRCVSSRLKYRLAFS